MFRPLAAAVAVLLLGCEGPASRPPDPADLPLRGTRPAAPMEKVGFTMPDALGELYDFRTETRGRIALLYFGYTFCPDVCPIQMATLGAAIRELDPEARDRVEVVFVTVDPERDTPDRLQRWLAAFDTSFVGVRGSPDQVADALGSFRYPPPERSGEGEGYTVSHPAVVFLYTPDGKGRAMYDAATTRDTWLHDLRLVADYPWGDGTRPVDSGTDSPGTPQRGGGGSEGGAPIGGVGDLLVLDAYAAAPAEGTEGTRTSVYLTLANAGERTDTLVSLSSPVAASASLHAMQAGADGMTRMVSLDHGLTLPPGGTVRLTPGERHGMLEGVRAGAMVPGGTVELTLTFASAGSVTLSVPVVRYRDAGG